MNPLSLIPSAYMGWAKLIAIGALVLAIVSGVLWLRHTWMEDGRKEVRAEWAIEKAEIARQSLKLAEQATRDTATLQANADKSTGAKNAQIARLNTALSNALDSLRERPERPAQGDLPDAASSGASPGCTGAQLYRGDAQFLVRQADLADRLLADLAQCQAAYGAARGALSAGTIRAPGVDLVSRK